MKGIIPIIIVVLVAALAVWGVIAANIFANVSTIQGTYTDVSIVSAINSLEFVKRSLQQSLVYSFYQAAYNVSKNGGYSDTTNLKTINSLVYWRIITDTTQAPTCGIFYSGQTIYCTENVGLAKIINNIFNQYVDQLQATNFNIPTYSSVTIGGGQGSTSIQLTAMPNGNLETSKTNLYDIKDSAEIVQTIPTTFYKLFDFGINNFVDQDPIQPIILDAIENSINNYNPTTATSTATYTYCNATNGGLGAAQVFSGYYGSSYSGIQNSISNQIKNQINSLSIQTPSSMSLNVSLLANPFVKITAGSCSQTTLTACDSLGNFTVKETCTYSYIASASAGVSVKSLQDIYPVYNGTNTGFKNLELDFALGSCNVNSQSACRFS